MARAVACRGHEVAIFTTNKDGWEALDVPLDRPVEQDGVSTRFFPIQWPRFWDTSWPMALALAHQVPQVDIVHLHSLYLFHDWIVGRQCRRNGVPYVLRPHGTLDPYIHRRHRLRKKLLEFWFQDSVTRAAAALHFTTDEEMRLAEPYSLGTRGVVVPNGIEARDYADLPPRTTFRRKFPGLGERPIVLFFGRLNFKKGLDVLIPAFADVAREFPDAQLVLAGPDGGMRGKAEDWVKDHGLSDRTLFTGLLTGKDKKAVLADADLFVLPSYSENFGIAVVEAMASSLPVLITNKVNIWREVEEAGAGVVAPPERKAFAQAIAELLKAPGRRAVMAEAGQKLAVERYDWRQVGAQLEAMYQDIIS